MIRRFVAFLRKAVSKAVRLPNPELQGPARDYIRTHVPDTSEYGPGDVDEARARRIADAYEAMPHNPDDPAALPALTSETRDQNSWVNFGPHLRRSDGSLPRKGDPDWIHPAERPFAAQKAGLLPETFQVPTPS